MNIGLIASKAGVMHQLGALSEDEQLDPDVFAAQANAILRAR